MRPARQGGRHHRAGRGSVKDRPEIPQEGAKILVVDIDPHTARIRRGDFRRQMVRPLDKAVSPKSEVEAMVPSPSRFGQIRYPVNQAGIV